MSLIVEIKVNDVLIARAVARNQSNLADISDYVVDARINESKFGAGQKFTGLEIKGHNRNSPVWSLVEKMMKVILGTLPQVHYFEFKGQNYKATTLDGFTEVEPCGPNT